MTKQEHIEYWLKLAKRDLESAESIFEARRYDWCLFIAHLVIEKTLKAFWVRDCDKPIPHIHNLSKLAKETKLQLTEEQKAYLDSIASFNILTRYTDYKDEFYKTCTKEFATQHLKKMKELYQWLLSQIKSEPTLQDSFTDSMPTI